MDGDEGRDRKRERDRERRRRELEEMRVCGASVGAVLGRSEYVEVGGGNAVVGCDGVSGSVLEDGFGHVIRTLDSSLKLRSKTERV